MPQPDMESSGLIMKVIRTLTNSKDDAERDATKKRLEDALKDSDANLTKLVSMNHKELKLVVQTFTTVTKNLQTSLVKLYRAKQRLLDCREMLTSRLEELRRLSEESRRSEKILSLLDQIDELSKVPSQIDELLGKYQYYDAAKLLLEKQQYIDENFDSFDCFKEVKSELDGKREEMYRIFEEKRFLPESDTTRAEIIESLKLIDRSPELADTEVVKDKSEMVSSKSSLFKFSLSSHAICFNEHYNI